MILSGDCPEEFPGDFYRNYLHLLLSVFHLVCRDVRELRHLVNNGGSRWVGVMCLEGKCGKYFFLLSM